jgi:hypothetical protein
VKTGIGAAIRQTEQNMAKKPQKPTPQQQAGSASPASQMGASNAPQPQQGQTPVIRDWASI